MTKIKHLVDKIDGELCDAKEYAECYIDQRVVGNATYANRYKEMANDELQHSMYLHEMAVHNIEDLRKVYTPPQDMLDVWDKAHTKYVEKSAWIKQMLTL